MKKIRRVRPETAKHNPSHFGRAVEQQVRRHLEAAGLVLQDSNYRAGHGEVDLIMRDGPHLVFVEVRYRRDGRGAESVDMHKRRRLISAAQHYLQRIPGLPPRCRFDVVAVQGSVEQPHIEWIKDAFGVS